MPNVAVALLAAAVTACAGAPIVTHEPTPTAVSTPTESPPTTTPPPSGNSPPPQGTPGPGATPGPTAIDLLPLLSSQITVVNLEDRTLTLTVTLLDTATADEYEVGTFEIQPLQVTTQSVIPTRLRIEFEFVGSSASGGSCTIDVADGEQLQFAAVATGIAITTTGQEPVDPADMLVSSAARCHAGATT